MSEARLSRRLGLMEAVTIGIGGMIGGAIFEAIGVIAGVVGPGMVFSFMFAALLALLTGYSYTKLGPMFPESGGSFTYVYRAFGGRLFSVFIGYMLWFSYAAASSLYAIAFSSYMRLFLPSINPLLTALLVLFTFFALNLRGVKEVGSTQNVLVLVKVGALVVLISLALTKIAPENFDPLLPNGVLAVFIGSSLIFIGYEGFDIIGTSAEELKDPRRTIPRAIYISILIVSTLYILVSLVSVGVIRYSELAGQHAPLAVVAGRAAGDWGAMLLGVGGLVSTASALNAALYGASRVAYNLAMHNILPKWFGRLNKRRVPYVPVVGTSVVIAALVLMGLLSRDGARFASALSSASFMLIFFLVTLSNYKLRAVTKANTRLLQVTIALFLFAMALLLFEDPWSWFIVLVWVVSSVIADLLLRRYISRFFYYTPEDSEALLVEGRAKETRKKTDSFLPTIR